MVWQYTPYTAPLFVAAVVSLGVAAFALRYHDRPGGRPLAALMIGVGLWAFADAMQLARANLAGKLLWARMDVVVLGLLPAAWLVLVLEYVGEGRWLTRSRLAALTVEPLAMVGLLAARPDLFHADVATVTAGNYLVFDATFGPAFYVHFIYAYLLFLVGAALLVKVLFVAESLYRTQATALLAALSLPLIAKAAYLVGSFGPVTDPTSIGFLFTGLVIAGTILKRQLLELVPAAREVARDEVLENMDDRVIVLDDSDRVADINPAAADLVDCQEDEAIGRPIDELLAPAAELLSGIDAEQAQAQLSIETDAGVRYFDVRVSTLERAPGAVAGRLVSLRDVTEKRQQRQRLDVLNRLLRHNLRNDMNIITGNAELVKNQLSNEGLAERLERIEATAMGVTTQTNKIGRAARILDGERQETVDLVDSVEVEIEEARQRYPHAEITLELADGPDITVDPAIAIAIDELLANAVEHNDGTPAVDARVGETDGLAVIEVADNGPGIDPHELAMLEEGEETVLQHGSGVGLWVVYWVVEQFGGRLEFDNEPDGCTVAVWLPLGSMESVDGSTQDDGTAARENYPVTVGPEPTGAPDQ